MSKFILFAVLLLSFSISAYSQEVLDSNLIRAIEKKSEKKEKRLNKQLLMGELSHPIQVTYQIDEYRIEEYLNQQIQRDESSANYISQLLLAEKRYQVLMSKYFNILSELLNDVDKDILEITQARWQGYKQYEQAVNKMLNPEAYQMKTIPMEKLAERHLDITKFRVMELADYISRMSKIKD